MYLTYTSYNRLYRQMLLASNVHPFMYDTQFHVRHTLSYTTHPFIYDTPFHIRHTLSCTTHHFHVRHTIFMYDTLFHVRHTLSCTTHPFMYDISCTTHHFMYDTSFHVRHTIFMYFTQSTLLRKGYREAHHPCLLIVLAVLLLETFTVKLSPLFQI